MKKIIISLSILSLLINLKAQDSLLVTKNGSIYMPQKGEIGVGLSAEPFLNYIGNMFNGNTNNSLALNDQELYFRYFIKNDAAIRLNIKIRSSKDVENYYVLDDAAKALDPLSLRQVDDRLTTIDNLYHFSLGYERFKGIKRLRGFYGADLGYSYQKRREKYEYGNQMNQVNPTPTTNWGKLSSRILENNGGQQNVISIGVFAGVEYFFLPKFCIGTELGLIYGKSWESQSYSKGEEMVVSQHVYYDRALSPGNSGFNLTTSFPYSYGNLYLMFHF
jgi:hypothetical protein